ncbi:MAG: TonB-dependent receptor [Bacteroidota bacterium]
MSSFKIPKFKARFLFLLPLLFISLLINSQVKGKVVDKSTGESLVGATVYLFTTKHSDFVGLNGNYHIKKISPGAYTITAQFIGYLKQEKLIEITDTSKAITVDFALTSNSNLLNEITISTTQDKGSDNYARGLEKNSDNVINVISAKNIQLLPDVTIGNVLQRMSGVTVEKTSSGEGRYATIRGMDKRYNYTTIDGIKIPSPDFKNRYVPMDIFPAEIVERLEVSKSLTPNMEGDAIGGATNLVLKSAPQAFLVNANASLGYNQFLFNKPFTSFDTKGINKKSPSQMHPGVLATNADFPTASYTYKNIEPQPNIVASLSIGNRFLKRKQLGILISGSYQNTYNLTNDVFLLPAAQPQWTPPNQPLIADILLRTYSLQQIRKAIHTKIDYVFNPRHKISIYSMYVGLDAIRQRNTIDTIGIGSAIANVEKHFESKVIYQSIYNSTLHGEHTIIKNLVLDYSGAYSKAWANSPDWGSITINGVASSPTYKWKTYTRRWLQTSDEDISYYANLTYSLNVFKQGIELKAGGMNRNKTRNNFYDSYDLSFAPNQVVTDNGIKETTFFVYNGFGSASDANNYLINENVNAMYGQAKLTLLNKLQLLGGARIEKTTQAFTTAVPENIPGKSGGKKYQDILPSGSIKYTITGKQNIRANYYSSISRPSFYELIPYTITGEDFNEIGNPYLKRTKAKNYDLRYELFPKPSEQILVGVFYKNIINPVEYSFVRESGSPSALNLQPQNFGIATNYGFEFVINKFFKQFGVSANYCYTKSQITTDKILYYHDDVKGNTNKIVSQTRPLQGQADHIANLSFVYKNPKIGLDALISAVYTGKLITLVSSAYGLDYYQMPMTRLDFSCEKMLSNRNRNFKFYLFAKVNNILNTKSVVRIMQPNLTLPDGSLYLPIQDSRNSIVVQRQQYGQGYLFGIRYKF